jgi:hypothetical protein
MPFDAPSVLFKNEVDWSALDRFRADPNLPDFAYILRHTELFPPTFRWYYKAWGSCACGLAAEILGQKWEGKDALHWAAEVFKIADYHAALLFATCHGRACAQVVHPTDVAKTIERYLATGVVLPKTTAIAGSAVPYSPTVSVG